MASASDWAVAPDFALIGAESCSATQPGSVCSCIVEE
jgi:hypothetical protein